jgi:hypothetical protein
MNKLKLKPGFLFLTMRSVALLALGGWPIRSAAAEGTNAVSSTSSVLTL